MALSLLRRQEVERRTGLARSTIYKLMSTGDFPRPVRLIGRSIGWPSTAVDAWIASRIEAAMSKGE